MNEALLSIVGVIGALAGIIRWLLQVYFKQAQELESLKKKFTDEAIDELKVTVENHKKELFVIKDRLDSAAAGYKSNQTGFKEVTDSLRNFVESNDRELERMRTQIIQLSKDIIMLKDVKSGRPKN